ncbi:MAG TPA: hypothetical protein VEV39_08425, partial [Gemmatimonadales bacterium]|nr:hypothetical protein [Gemmatimonadales bacterium]
QEALAETALLRENGADEAVAARLALLRRLVAAADTWLSQELDTAQAAREAGRSTETIRRAVRGGRLPDRRENPKAHIAIRRRDLQQLATTEDGSYDPTADAQDIARLRRKT